MQCPICGNLAVRVEVSNLKRELWRCMGCEHCFVPAETHNYADRGVGYFNQNCNHQGIKSVVDSPEWDGYVNGHLAKLNDHGMNLQPGATVVEIGCLEGQILNRLKTMGVNVIGYELNQEMAALHDFTRPVDINDDSSIDLFSVDSIYSFHTYEHIDEVVQTVNKCAELLKSGGRMFFEVPFQETDYWNPDHVHFFSFRSLERITRDFKDIRVTLDRFANCHGIKCEQIQVSGAVQ